MRITLDPWGGDPASQITVPYKIDSADTSVLALDDPIEDRPWAPVVPAPPALPTVTVVVDGVLRSDMTALVAEGEQQALALFGSYATGAVVMDHHAELAHDQVARLFIVGGNQASPDVDVPAGSGRPLRYRGYSAPCDTHEKLWETLITAMCKAEAGMAEALSTPTSLILADGNLTFLGGSSCVVGVIKSLHRIYLTGRRAAILERLRPRERTPLFRIVSGQRCERYQVLTCYLRLAPPQRIEPACAGLVRLEVKASLGMPHAVVLLEQAAVHVCALASHAPKDPRAPQNLIPLGGLERQLRHKLGDPLLVRRGIARALCARV
jgi:uncharacterized protein